jgi:hypothetical protein
MEAIMEVPAILSFQRTDLARQLLPGTHPRNGEMLKPK